MSATTRRLRSLALDRTFGGGFAGFAASVAIGWGIDQLRKVGDPVTIDATDLRPGEQYVVTARPAMKRKERKVFAKQQAARRRLNTATAPSRSTVRVARKLSRAQRQADRRPTGSPRQQRAVRRSERLGAAYDRRVVPSRKVARLQRNADALDAELTALRAAKAGPRKRRVPRTRIYR